ncbi:MAG: hypothetical protein EXS37_06340 [Opitutus sp.]|nr:hypothetical protein [Opitutus sp.]
MKLPLPFLLIAAIAQAAPTASAPATLTKETDLTTITLKPEAEQRLRLKTVPVVRRAMPATRLFAGEVVRPLAVGGMKVAPVLGGTLDETLRVADAQAVADGRVSAAQVQLEAATVAADRAQKILEAEAGSARSVDDTKAAVALAGAALATARAQRALLGAPLQAGDGAGPMWVRAAIYSGEATLLDAQAGVTIRALGNATTVHPAAPVAGPATANAATSTVDWYYEISAAPVLRPGERVAVEIPLRENATERLVVPFNAVLHDIHGGQWVYEAIAPHVYTRRRVQVSRLAGGDAVLASGPAVGASIVTDGAAELFGTEFMTGK